MTFTSADRVRDVIHGFNDDGFESLTTWSLARLADFLVAEGVVDDISHEVLRVLLREEGISFQRMKTWKTSRDRWVIPEGREPEVVFCMDEFGPLSLQPHPGRQRAERGGKHKDRTRTPGPGDERLTPARTESGMGSGRS
ncbi:hypothetical protein OG735_02270 [Streptomyces sp. NBC_01210]|uniref:hypothetical protein n=1 Tax=Streptomyces sp. NBC_01210 TaxID=2903774 RepID=UPI003FA3D3E1|nr:hypothetical protein OG735_02270 [Streptomyces sp. NBC_01210]